MPGTMTCQRCGTKGKLELQPLDSTPTEQMFKFVGHNPFSGHLHYQCPACEIVLLVAPTAALGGLLSRYAEAFPEGLGPLSTASPPATSFLRRLFSDQQALPTSMS